MSLEVRIPRIVVVLPVYNGEKYLAEAVRSVLDQTFTDFELVVVDDGSTDRTAEILARYLDPRLRVIRFPENRGIVAALNAGIRESESELIARMDADDICMPQRFERQVAFLDAHPDVVLCGTWTHQFGDESGILRPPVNSEPIRARLFFGWAMDHPSVMMRRSFLEQHGLEYDDTFPHSEDFAFFIRAGELGVIANVPEVLVRTRAHKDEVSVVYAQDQLIEISGAFLRQLRLLMPDVSSENESFHVQLVSGTLHMTSRARVEQWLLLLDQANIASGRFDATAFQAELRRKWSHFHLQVSSSGPATLISYWRSPLADAFGVGFQEHFRLVVNCLLAVPLRWRRAYRRFLHQRRVQKLAERD